LLRDKPREGSDASSAAAIASAALLSAHLVLELGRAGAALLELGRHGDHQRRADAQVATHPAETKGRHAPSFATGGARAWGAGPSRAVFYGLTGPRGARICWR
jgi:hypothetical protein